MQTVLKDKNFPFRMTKEDHYNLKLHCVKNGISMQQFLENLVDKELEKLKEKV